MIRIRVLLRFAWVLAVTQVFSGTASAATCTWTGAWDTLPSTTTDVILINSGGNLEWSNSFPSTVASWTQASGYTCTAMFTTVYGPGGFTNFTITGDATIAGGAWTHRTNSATESNRLCVTIGGNLLVTNASILANGRGFYGRWGTGAGAVGTDGGSHGGLSGLSGGTGTTYGSICTPTSLGCGGGGTGGDSRNAGGGAMLLTVGGTTTVASAGNLTANGLGLGNFGGGSGGSVFLTTGWLTGSGGIMAQGETMLYNGNAGGGGGRVAIVLTGAGADFSTWTGSNSAYGGGGPGGAGAAGTVYLRTKAGAGSLIVDNNGLVTLGVVMTLMPNSVDLNSFSNVTVHHKGVLGVRGDTALDFRTANLVTYGATNSFIDIVSDTNVIYPSPWTISGYTLCGEGISRTLTNLIIGNDGALSHCQNSTNELYKLNLTIVGDLTVLSNGAIHADYKGYATGKGPSTGDGASYGGLGGACAPTYGSIVSPTNFGSGGAGYNTYGGGAIRLAVAGTTTVAAAGAISANGQAAGNGGAGAGGSVFLTTGWLTGSGIIRANGGTYQYNFASGGGGRVAIVLTGAGADFSTWTGSNTAYGGAAQTRNAAAGTVYRRNLADSYEVGTVIVDNRSTATNATFTSLPAFTNSAESLRKTLWLVQNKARVNLLTNATIWSLALTNAYVELTGYTLTTRQLTITNKVYGVGTYAASQLGALVADSSGGSGRIRVTGLGLGTVFMMK